ncbi:hypothetical protein MINTM008_08380 [Mycobacterium intracellulare]|uniref:HTH tetR-type domain-containing protein n=2 Tax=Mycobacterium TaxID=1763 RepID=A0ABQ1BSF8_9MYCO|nr:hypothetical protein MINTM008_08380 [Mycobacterium intracellulare]BCP19021.1 hypothetical protein MINTM023_08100 [Mycobacterium intracellulare]BCP29922.1 hypothetical protein MINTM026_08920 [Mycobacterium intracellulare]BCP40745.1 hypothetical protein MINTMi27_08380 [Mycobacterium intracellulare]GFG66430.1 hypothetical protein MKUB_39200 [Mycobacterium kubicae]
MVIFDSKQVWSSTARTEHLCKTHILLTMSTESVRLSFRQHMREQVLRAARDLTIEKGWHRVRMSEVAKLVGVSRPTLYKEFTDKQGLGDALVVSEGERFLNGIHAVSAQHAGDVRGGITAAVSYTLEEAEASPLLKAVLTSNRPTDKTVSETTGMLPLLPTSASLLELSSAALVTWFNEHFPGLDADDVHEVADALVRLTVSHVVLPSADASLTGERSRGSPFAIWAQIPRGRLHNADFCLDVDFIEKSVNTGVETLAREDPHDCQRFRSEVVGGASFSTFV